MFKMKRQTNQAMKENSENRISKTDHAADGPAVIRFPDDTEDIIDDSLEDPEFPDTEGIGYDSCPDGSVLGYVEHVNGPQAEACFEFQATRHELMILAGYWYRELMEIELLWFADQTTGSTEWRTAKYATRRIARIRRMIGDLADEAFSEVDAEFRKLMGEAEWDRFKALCSGGKYSPW